MPVPTQRIMLSEVTLMMEAVSWEMRLVTPYGSTPPPLPDNLSVAGRQRLDMKHAVAEHLQEVVRSFISSSQVNTPAHGETPFLIAIAQQLADAVAHSATRSELPSSSLQSTTSIFSHDVINDALQASAVLCLAPSVEGPLKLGIALRDPHVFSCLVGRGRSQLPVPGTTPWSEQGYGQDDNGALCADALRDIGISNEATCMSVVATSTFRSLRLFASALLYHLAGGTRSSNIARDPRAQALRAHLEALLPELGAPMLSNQAQCRAETFTGFATSLISAMQLVESPAPLTFAYSLFRVLRGVAVHTNTNSETKSHAHHGLLLLLQRVLPDLHGSVAAEGGLVDLGEDDLAELRKLVSVLLGRASSPDTDTASTYALADAPSAAPFPDTSLPLLAALLARVPAGQLKSVFPTPDLWLQLTALLRASQVPNPRGQKLRCAAMSAAVALCRTPALTSALFESGGLAAVTDPDLMTSKVQISPQGLPVLEAPHPAILLSILEVLVAMTGALPTHRMVICEVLNWVEQHNRVLLEVLQWVARLPITVAAEPRALDRNGLGNGLGSGDLGGALQSAAIVSTMVDMSAGAVQDSLLLVFCAGGADGSHEATDATLERASITLSGRCWVSDFNADNVTQLEARDRVVALCYRCTRLFSELFAALCVAVQRCSATPGAAAPGQVPQPMLAQIARIVPMFEPTLGAVLSQMAAAEPPRFRDAVMQDAAQNDAPVGGILEPAASRPAQASAVPQNQSDFGLYASESTRLAVCMHILHAWRHDPSTQKLLTLVQAGSCSLAAPQASVTGYGFGSYGLGLPPVGTMSGAAAVSEASGVVSELVTLARSRVNVLCTVFVHTCQELLAMHLVNRPRVGMDQNLGDAPHLQFEGSREHFRHVLFLVEVSLHLLQSHLSVLILGGIGAAAASGAPRLPLVLQYLRVLQQFTNAVGGKVALAERLPPAGGTAATPGAFAAVRAVELLYAARAAGRVEQSLMELQSL